jgi:hypothetical protein
LRAVGGQFRVSFLFATPTTEGMTSGGRWHRWTTKSGFGANTGWHHIAVTYRFGDPTTVRGWIDGKSMPGDWDMGGATTVAPVVDDDAVWIGSSMRANPASSFRGSLDAIAIHREIVSDAELKARFQRTGGSIIAQALPAVMPELGPIPAGRVLATFHEGMPAHDRWLNEGEKLPAEITRWTGQEFLLPRLPLRYDPWGIRASWKAPVLTRMAAEVTLPAGTHRVVLRARAEPALDGRCARCQHETAHRRFRWSRSREAGGDPAPPWASSGRLHDAGGERRGRRKTGGVRTFCARDPHWRAALPSGTR